MTSFCIWIWEKGIHETCNGFCISSHMHLSVWQDVTCIMIPSSHSCHHLVLCTHNTATACQLKTAQLAGACTGLANASPADGGLVYSQCLRCLRTA